MIRSCLMPELMKTLFTPGICLSLLRRSTCLEWSLSRVGQSAEHSLSGQVPFFQRGHEREYMFAVGPPTSVIMPLKPCILVSRVASRRMESMLRLCTIRPWWWVRAQKEQEPKQPLWLVMEKRTGSRAGMASRYDGWAALLNGSS